MKVNQTVYLDLFSILATGVFVIMNTVTGPDNPDSSSRPEYTIVRAFFGISSTLRQLESNPVFSDIVVVDPFFLIDGKEVSISEMPVPVDVGRTIEGIQVMIRGKVSNGAVGFRLRSILDIRAIGETAEFKIIIVGGRSPVEGIYEIGKWTDPVIDLS
ncbi:MAG: hypothetical protein KDK08_23175 [Rhizobiaceae bacterium]|nr:hypothetical protein [Rhizobiaceae bacterium]